MHAMSYQCNVPNNWRSYYVYKLTVIFCGYRKVYTRDANDTRYVHGFRAFFRDLRETDTYTVKCDSTMRGAFVRGHCCFSYNL